MNMNGFIDYRKINRTVMDDTMKLCGHNKSLKESITNSIKNEYVVYQSDAFDAGEIKQNPEMKIIVSKKRTFEAAEGYACPGKVLFAAFRLHFSCFQNEAGRFFRPCGSPEGFIAQISQL